ncbi:bifunctional hydroxymethylpyrimidine kinase/phosphomethylpyrimidine kinase [Salipiger abyssi]|uniref:bifunctional hydroxymethylpyrimidine kinase/phosphomethylpyrimidine kinase n=1 Tax=Salipiger abyssi TaxID=1250539 RepID=UPI004057D49A
MIPNVLSIAGTDPSGGAGIQADIKAFSALGAYACSAITAVVAQNTRGVRSFVALEPEFVAEQIDAVLEDVRIDAVKIGMIANAAIAEAIADRLRHHQMRNIVLDPVMVAKSGHALLAPEAVDAVRDLLVPLATILTPNLPEAAVLLDRQHGWSAETMQAALPELLALGSDWVLLKGGHLEGSATSADLLAGPDGSVETFSAPRLHTSNDHGTGCTLSSAIAALLPRYGVAGAVGRAKAYLHAALAGSDALDVGSGHGPVHHFHALWATEDA